MLKYIFLIIIAFLLSSCQAVTYSYNSKDKNLDFKTVDDNFYSIKLFEPKKVSNFSECSLFSYTLKDSLPQYGKIFIEQINLESNCQFNSNALGLFLYEFKENLKLNSLKQKDFFTYNNYEFYTYKINDSRFINFIYIYGVFSYTFIVDYEGKISQELIGQFNTSFKSKYLHKKRFEKDYNYSLVKMNTLKAYFTKMSEDYGN